MYACICNVFGVSIPLQMLTIKLNIFIHNNIWPSLVTNKNANPGVPTQPPQTFSPLNTSLTTIVMLLLLFMLLLLSVLSVSCWIHVNRDMMSVLPQRNDDCINTETTTQNLNEITEMKRTHTHIHSSGERVCTWACIQSHKHGAHIHTRSQDSGVGGNRAW